MTHLVLLLICIDTFLLLLRMSLEHQLGRLGTEVQPVNGVGNEGNDERGEWQGGEFGDGALCVREIGNESSRD